MTNIAKKPRSSLRDFRVSRKNPIEKLIHRNQKLVCDEYSGRNVSAKIRKTRQIGRYCALLLLNFPKLVSKEILLKNCECCSQKAIGSDFNSFTRNLKNKLPEITFETHRDKR